MNTEFEDRLPYGILALAVLALFYGIYFAKIFALRKRGIRTNQIGSQNDRRVRIVETVMSVATVSVVAAQIASILLDANVMPSGARLTGVLLGFVGDIVFFFAVVQMRDSWRVGIPGDGRTKIVTGGIYAYSRNPAFLGFDLMYSGMLLMYCNAYTAILTVFAAFMLHMQILQEEKYLAKTFGEEYLLYKKRVFRYLGRIK